MPSKEWHVFKRGQRLYGRHVLALVSPGIVAPSHKAHPTKPKSIEKWEDSELQIMVDEGRRQVDRQLNDLDRVRLRAQWLFTTGVAATAALGAGLAQARPHFGVLALWIAALLVLAWGLAGAAAVSVTRADFRQIVTTTLSATPQPVLLGLAKAYARMTGVGEETVATRLTVFRQSVVFSVVGGYLGLLAVLLDQAFH